MLIGSYRCLVSPDGKKSSMRSAPTYKYVWLYINALHKGFSLQVITQVERGKLLGCPFRYPEPLTSSTSSCWTAGVGIRATESRKRLLARRRLLDIARRRREQLYHSAALSEHGESTTTTKVVATEVENDQSTTTCNIRRVYSSPELSRAEYWTKRSTVNYRMQEDPKHNHNPSPCIWLLNCKILLLS